MTVAKAIVPYLALPSGTLRHSKSQDTLVNETPDDTSEERFVKMTMDVQPDIHGDRGRLAQYNLNGLLGSGATGRAVKEISTENIIMKRAPGTFFKLVMLGSGKRAPEAQKVVVDGKPMNMIRKEIAILKKLRHAHTVKLHEVLECNDAKTVYLANILQGADGNIKIADFGLSVMFKEDESSADREWAGSRAFMAPEHARDRTSPFTKATDIWAMGVTLYMMYTGRPPFKEQYCRPLTQVIREDDFPPVGNTRLEALLKKLLHKDPSKRHTMDQLRHDTWVTDCYSHRLITKAENIEHAVRDISELEIERAIKQAKLAVVVKKCVDTLSSYMRSPRQPISAKMILAYMNQRNSPTSPEELEDSSLQSVSVETEPAEAVSSSSTSAPAGVFRINTAVASSGAAIGMSPLSPSAPVAILVAPATPTSPIADLDKDPRAQQFHRTFIPVNDETAEYIPAFNGLYRTGTFPKGFEPETFSSEAMKPKEVAALVQWNTFLEERKGEQN
ncbi:hypothetical protein BGZ83_003694 [Gryganskiella cystojenkinii]|nr:hypothetical protein BGZ83_003694 [Gryganskiella cystojenkinii]